MKKTIAVMGLLLVSTPAQASKLDFALGKALFDRPWSSAPASTQATDGLGPLFNARSCVACHPKGGRGKITVQENGDIGGIGYVLRLGNDNGEGDPVYGRQLQTNAIHGQKAEGRVFLKDGYYEIQDLAYGAMSKNTNFAGRLSQPLLGLGLLEQISDETILSLADPEDTDADGISGRANIIDGQVGRFAWKAAAPTLRIQAANAFSNDIGMSTPVHPQHEGDCTKAQVECVKGPHGDSPQFENLEIDSQMLNLVTAYLQGLKPPKSSPADDQGLFKSTGCADCHIPTLPIKNGHQVTAYSDLLLHDMGPALSDGIKEGLATGSEWRTQPLWGTKDTKYFLHDGRAQSVEEAVNWHGGEAQKAKERFNALNKSDKTILLNFVNSL
ncbi:di-heme oxidoredictase family protein [Terasakiella sp. A23]|uniref:di-heme oxidoredictase family protein n=1 Tax=Terasakiella sp. FCG-A23 TaxID=3080561 RepID=UPI0029556D6D|nr:di-heme oxidoredictase family protein [Terasakiella sp. A23]MDV7340240.1 di-heme oxidoredictase family protein [Terasakiella sp. A23]